jgi:hypothetical protein
MKNFENASKIVNGFWYSFSYNPKTFNKDVDKFPFIYCIGPSLKSLNNFVGLNLHHIPLKVRFELIYKFQKFYNFMNVDRRYIITREQLETLVPGIGIAIREYDKRHILDAYRIINKAVPLYLKSNGILIQASEDNAAIKWLEDSGFYKTEEQK